MGFRLSFAFSLLWHVFWLSAICVIVEPTVRLVEQHTDVNFLGPILTKTAYDIMVDESGIERETLYSSGAILTSMAKLEVDGPERMDKDYNSKLEKIYKIDQIDSSRGDKINSPIYIEQIGKSSYELAKDEFVSTKIEGPLKKRVLLFKPDMPTVKKPHYLDIPIFITKLKLLVNRNGNVKEVELVSSSGDSFIDLQCVNHIREWKFAPARISREANQWGVVTLDIKAR